MTDILFVCVDGLTGFPEAIEATFPHATVQTCLVHQVRSSMRFVSYKDRKPLAADLRKIYTAVDAEHAADELQAFAEKWDHRYPMISASWLEHWEQITPFLAYPAEVRRVIYTTNSIEALHRQLRKIIKTRGISPPRTPPASSSTSPSRRPRRSGSACFTGRRHSPRSRSSSGTAFLTVQCDCHYLTQRK